MDKVSDGQTASQDARKELTLCVLDDDAAMVEVTTLTLSRAGFDAIGTTDPNEALAGVRSGRFRVVLSDLQMPEMDGFKFLENALRVDPRVYVMLITGHYSFDSAIEAIKRGAYDYICKPVEYPRLLGTLDELAVALQRRTQIREFEDKILTTLEFEGIVGKSPAIREVFDLVRKISKHFKNVLLTGPTGSGKELFARALHAMSPVATERFAICNCSALVDTLLESQLFGHLRGAFTGAFDTRQGLFEYANGGTVFLDEIGETSVQMQAKLLRVIQNREIQRVGSPEVRNVNVRVIAATNRDLRAEVVGGRFREDLFYRLSTIEIRVPSLVERSEDIPLLVRYLLKRCSVEYGKNFQGLTRQAELALLQYQWPGNIRELENVISSATMTASGDFVDILDLPQHIQKNGSRTANPAEAWSPLPLEEIDRIHVERVLEMCNGNQVQAAEILGIGRTSLYRFLKRSAKRATDAASIGAVIPRRSALPVSK